VRRKKEVIETDRCFRRIGMPGRILLLYRRGVKERCSGNSVRDEAKNVQGREVYGETKGGLSFPVGDGLGVEGSGPSAQC
jgi:hypothetical protein